MDPWQGAENVSQEFYLVNKGAEYPDRIPEERIIQVPVKSVICFSTTHLAMLAELGEQGSVTGFSGTSFVYNEEYRSMISEGKIREIGYEGNINKELIITLNPDIIIAYGVEGETSSYISKLTELGIKVLFNADHLENDPVARLEWIKVFGALTGNEQKADEIYLEGMTRYDSIATFIRKNRRSRPAVMLGLPWRDSWYISPGNSYIGSLIDDAGGRYLWEDLKSEVTLPWSLENVFIKARRADFWLNPGSAESRNAIAVVEPRLKLLPVFREEGVFNNNKRRVVTGGNDYWESAVVNPDVLLNDIGSILHPELFPGYVTTYYQKLK